MVSHRFKKWLKYLFIGSGVTLITVFFVCVFIALLVMFNLAKSSKIAIRINEDFLNEVSELPGLTVDDFYLNSWDGFSRALITVPNKGKVDMYYYNKGVFSIISIGGHSLLFPCNNTRYSTWLYKGSPYLDWFPEVNSLQDLAKKYDNIVTSIEKLPTVPTEGYYIYHKSKNIFRPRDKIKCELIRQP